MQARFFDMENNYFVSHRGFLPKEMPLTQLPNTSKLNQEINQIAQNLPDLLAAHQLRKVIDQLNAKFSNQLLTFNIRDKREQDIALLFLTVIAQAYIWENKSNPMREVPAILGNTLELLCKIQNRYPTLLYSDYILNNYKWKNSSMNVISLDHIEPIITFTGTGDEAWFIKVHIVIEAVCSQAVFAAFQLCTRADLDITLLCELLNMITSSIKDSIPVLQQMKNGCDPDYFYNKLRPYYGAWNLIKNQENAGVKLKGFDLLGDLCFNYRGVSGAQSTLLPALDAALGIQHEQNAMHTLLQEFRNYMPKNHRHLITLLEKNNVKQKVITSNNEDLKKAWRAAVNGVASFRAMHISYISKYLAKPSGLPVEHLVGTSGTTNEFLAARYTSTRAASL